MPKKFQGENSKAVEAKARKQAVETEKRVKKEKEEEDKLWEDNDKLVLRKLERKAEQEKKAQEAHQKKLEREKLLEEEMSTLKSAKPSAAKVTRTHIENVLVRESQTRLEAKASQPDKSVVILHDAVPLHENVNRAAVGDGSARGVEEALEVLGITDDADKHPEKRAKAAYLAYEERELPRLKQEYPNFRLSQLKQLLKTNWQKSPENPFNRPVVKYNASKKSLTEEAE